MTIKIIVAGPRGKMGSEALKMIETEKIFELVACIDRKNNGKKVNELENLPKLNVPIFSDAKQCFKEIKADVFIDLTVPETGYIHTKLALTYKVHSIVGTTGFSNEELAELTNLAKDNKIGCIIAPNFAIGAILMMQFAKQAAKYMPHVEIIEKHHDEKLDAPSGTAIKTAELINETRNSIKQGAANEEEVITGARGGEYTGMRLHSVRLPGLVAHQEVIFGGPGQSLTIKHDSYNRESFMDGIKFSIEKVINLEELVYGLENII